jgi:quinohemoprotein ethanol dehydrogenase
VSSRIRGVSLGPASLAALLLLGGCGDDGPAQPPRKPAGWVDEARLANADAEPHNWYGTNRGLAEDHYSPLTEIDQGNVSTLGFAWHYKTRSTRGLEASPVVIDGVMYTSGNWGRVYAVDAKSGTEVWTYDPKVPGEWARRACCDIVNRGVEVWKGRVYVASLDGFMIALDAATGREVWRRDTLIDRTRFQTITGAPQIAGGKVIIGNSGGELGVRGYITAYDAATGEQAWRFFIVPGDPKKPFEHPEMEMASKTWDPDSMWDVGGGGTVWDSMAYDPKLNLLYVGTGNGSPHPIWSRSPSGGDNLFLASILAIDPDTGRLKWHYQTVPGDSWDYTATQQMVLTDLEIGGRKRQVLMQAPKNGFFYILDRATGELLSAEKYGKVNWATHVDLKTGRPVLTATADFSKSPKLIYPGQGGAHNWQAMSFDPRTGLVYIPMLEMPMVYAWVPKKKYHHGESNEFVDIFDVPDPRAGPQPTAGVDVAYVDYLQAWDPVAGVEKWRVATGGPFKSGGALATAGGLVFQGTGHGFLFAYAADTGALLATINVGTAIIAAPISYAVDGEQYVAVMAGAGGSGWWTYPKGSAPYRYGNEGRIVAFKLGGGAVPLPAPHVRTGAIPEPPAVPTSPEKVSRGKELFNTFRCVNCHNAGQPGLLPNLFALTPEKHRLFKEIVHGGALKANGMASFADVLSEADVDAIHDYVVAETNRLRAEASRP